MPFSKSYDPFQTTYAEFFSNEIDVIVCLSHKKECKARTDGIDLLERYGRDGFAIIYFPMQDFQPPEPHQFDQISGLVDRIELFLSRGCNVLVHCHAGIGRTSLLLACWANRYLFAHNLIKVLPDIEESLPKAVVWIRSKIRGALQTQEQINFVEKFKV